MANHPNRAPHQRLNILVTARQLTQGQIAADGTIVSDPTYAHGVWVRYGWSPLGNLEGDVRPTGIGVPCLSDSTPDVAGIQAAVAALRAAWGQLHVQDNSGAVPNLDQGLWNG